MNNLLNITNAFAIALGATLGAWIRWILGMFFNHLLTNLPIGTLLANLSGGLMVGITLGFIGLGTLDNQSVRLFITTGFLGGLTTFSSFTGESLILLQKQEYCWAAIHTCSHVFGALFMASLGYIFVQYLRA